MSEEKPTSVGTTISGWVKAAITSVVGLVSGAILMYLTPVVNNVIKPARPIANFATQVTGLTVEVNNRSTGGTSGWWDFGDGAALDPFDPKLDVIKHTYAKPGAYNVKLTLTNLLGDENDRTAPVVIDASSLPKPEIAMFKLVPFPFGSSGRAPATFELVSQIKNASFAILSVGDNRPMEVIADAGSQKRFVSFPEMGAYRVRLAAVSGGQLVEQTEDIFVGGSDCGDTMAKLQVTYDAIQVINHERTWRIPCKSEEATSFRKEHLAEQGCTILKAELVNADDPNIPENVQLEIAPDRSRVILTGDFAKADYWLARVKVSLEHRSAPKKFEPGFVMMPVDFKGPMSIPMQPLDTGWQAIAKQVSLQLWDGNRKVWEGSQASASIPVLINGKTYYLSATPQPDSMLLRVADAPVGPILPVSLKRDPVKNK